jgi:GrpB-like predicted nucleotidyltransferase (UPF0157 family)
MKAPLTIVGYDSRWPRLFDEEKTNILRVIGPMVMAIEHVGSTAVPGLAARPIIDLMIGVKHLSDATWCIQPLRTLDYEYIPEYEKLIPERHYFRKADQHEVLGSTHRLHMTEFKGVFWNQLLLFRDYLREHADEAQKYSDIKKTLAVRFGLDRESYMRAKTEFIQGIIEKAQTGKP